MSFWRIMLVVVVVTAGLSLGGCRIFSSFFDHSRPYSRPAPATPAPVSTSAQDISQTAVQTVKDYVAALRSDDYAKAYDLLSLDSQSKHTREKFEKQGKQGMPLYDLERARVTIKGKSAQVEIPEIEDPATFGFHLVREGEAWKVVYRGGIPGAPYAE